MQKIAKAFCLLWIIGMTGCATQNEFNYKTSYVNQPRLNVVPGLSNVAEDAYPIPFTQVGDIKQPVSLVPPGSHIEKKSKRGNE